MQRGPAIGRRCSFCAAKPNHRHSAFSLAAQFPVFSPSFLEMTSPKKCSSDARKYRTRHKYRGKRRKTVKKTTAGNDARDAPTSVRPTADTGHRDSGEIDAAVDFVSASQKKMEFFKSESRSVGAPAASTVLCEIGALTALVTGSACPTCCERKLAVREAAEKRKGLSSHLELRCENTDCPESVLSFTHTSKRIVSAGACGDSGANTRYDSGSSRDGFAVNVKAVLAARAIGVGYDQLSRFCAIIGLPKPLHHKTFHAISKKLHGAAMEAVSQNLELARKVTKDAVGGGDVPVMFDGTWQKRGHKSHNGVGTAVSLDTGLCLDFEVLSNYCLACSIHKDMGDDDEVWQAFHRPVCEKNTECSSHAMEPEAAVRIWQRTSSYETPLRFTSFLSDGDSKAFTAVCGAEVYGDTVIEKEECTNHVAKRLGTALRKMTTPLPRGEKLTVAAIQKLQTYYQIAITNNKGSVRSMYTAIWASYFHCCSSDGASSHKFCPAEPDSWCKHRRAEALGEPTPRHTPLLTKAQGLAIMPIYKRLTDEKLLARCLHGKTQNAAESLNSKIWLLCPKTKFASRTSVETATAIAVLWYNKGHAGFEEVLQEIGLLPPGELVTHSDHSDDMRIKKMNLKRTAEARAHRRNAVKRARTEETNRRSREGPSYSAGAF
ncbi:uncharacterized protein [Dermacentor andersoni]|uniref:uncharacterized protein n=1 Tax=Dermacentor andersoni TaxID=34620 RepID=UPI0021555F02|nr:uncharacterized protein LOC126530834 [Dermacentor andersoni]